jgi:hypothetical protein
MSPAKFLRLCYPLPDYEKNDESSLNLRNRMEKGLPVDPLVLVIDVTKKKVTGHEGRHRATVANELGIKTVPVLIYTGSSFRRVPSWSPEDHEMADKADFKPEWAKENLQLGDGDGLKNEVVQFINRLLAKGILGSYHRDLTSGDTPAKDFAEDLEHQLISSIEQWIRTVNNRGNRENDEGGMIR